MLCQFHLNATTRARERGGGGSGHREASHRGLHPLHQVALQWEDILMHVFVIGSGAREHALVWKLAQSSRVTKMYAAPGNPGMLPYAECVPLGVTQLRNWQPLRKATY